MMKQILLRVTTVFAKVCFGKPTQPRRAQFSSPPKILLFQNALHPHIDRECAEPLVCKEHHAICNLRSHTWQLAQVLPKIAIGKRRPSLEITFAGAHYLRCRAQVFGAITE